MTSPPPPTKGTRYFAKKRALVVIVFTLLVLSYFVVWFQITIANPPSGPKGPASNAELFKIENNTLFQLVKRTDVQFVNSTGDVPYYLVVSASNRKQVTGLVYLTTDVAPEWTYGYNSQVAVLVFVSETGKIESVKTWQMQESFGYLVTDDWLSRFVNRSVSEPLEVGKDVDAITSATLTSRSIASGVREAGRRVVDDYGTNERKKMDPWGYFLASATAMVREDDLIRAAIMAGMFGAAGVAYVRKDERFRYAVLAGAVLFIGVYAERMISIVDLTHLMWGTFPPLFSNIYWYVLYGGALVTSLIWGRLYCGYLCPFGAFTQIISKISPLKKKMPTTIHSKLVYLKYAILATVVAGVFAGSGWITGVEPFQTFFLLQGDWWMWPIMMAAVILSVPFNRFYCSYVCPAGAVLSIAGRARVREIRRWPECDRCRVCERSCPQSAISGPKISVLECFNCRDCEKNYLNIKICPHYALRRRNPQMKTT